MSSARACAVSDTRSARCNLPRTTYTWDLGSRMVSAHDQPDEDGIADRESIGLKELRSDFESGAFWGAVETPAAGRAYAARCATRPRAQHA